MASLSVAGVILFELTTFSNRPQPTLASVKTFEATGPLKTTPLLLAVLLQPSIVLSVGLKLMEALVDSCELRFWFYPHLSVSDETEGAGTNRCGSSGKES